MLSKWPIRNKLLIGIALLMIIVAILSTSGVVGIYRYRGLVRALGLRSRELPTATQLYLNVSKLRILVSEANGASFTPFVTPNEPPPDVQLLRQRFRMQLSDVESTFSNYRDLLDHNDTSDYRINDSRREHEGVAKIIRIIEQIKATDQETNWVFNDVKTKELAEQLDALQQQAVAIPGFLHQRLFELHNDVRGQYNMLIGLQWAATALAIVMFALLVKLFYSWVFRPLRVLIKGSRRVAKGDFDHRIHLQTDDEMSELAGAMNDMTERFQTIRDDLNDQVKVRTKQVVRSEQLASVGFLAAGVAHEINNPLASIAMCAESLETRVDDVLAVGDERHKIVCNYLRMIQEQAFRCKGITERLLDFSRMGEVERTDTDLRALVEGVIDMVRHLGKYRDKQVELVDGPKVVAPVNAQQINQVVLNLITNGLDSVEAGGLVQVTIGADRDNAILTLTDNGCGMTAEVLENLYEPFFTRSRGEQGTGLGLSIAYSIVADHDGEIDASSDGEGFGSQFRVTFPLVVKKKEQENQHQAA